MSTTIELIPDHEVKFYGYSGRNFSNKKGNYLLVKNGDKWGNVYFSETCEVFVEVDFDLGCHFQEISIISQPISNPFYLPYIKIDMERLKKSGILTQNKEEYNLLRSVFAKAGFNTQWMDDNNSVRRSLVWRYEENSLDRKNIVTADGIEGTNKRIIYKSFWDFINNIAVPDKIEVSIRPKCHAVVTRRGVVVNGIELSALKIRELAAALEKVGANL